ncbi:hypothetical protein GY45DRAFT_368444 [Cubamyces sp. BRFM 1775]|nr:hypothetical protein GY45DRAFT_368444 [Cubamyces sp. BRFM 1775]
MRTCRLILFSRWEWAGASASRDTGAKYWPILQVPVNVWAHLDNDEDGSWRRTYRYLMRQAPANARGERTSSKGIRRSLACAGSSLSHGQK